MSSLIPTRIVIAVIAGTAMIAGTIAAVFHLITKNNSVSLTLGTLAIPVLVCVSLVYWLNTMEADDPAPGNILIGDLILIALLTPVAFFASNLTIKFLPRRAARSSS